MSISNYILLACLIGFCAVNLKAWLRRRRAKREKERAVADVLSTIKNATDSNGKPLFDSVTQINEKPVSADVGVAMWAECAECGGRIDLDGEYEHFLTGTGDGATRMNFVHTSCETSSTIGHLANRFDDSGRSLVGRVPENRS